MSGAGADTWQESDGRLRAIWRQVESEEGSVRADGLTDFGRRLLDLGRHQEARAAVQAARDLYEAIDRPFELAVCDHNEAVILSRQGAQAEAAGLFRSAIDGLLELSALGAAARSRCGLARCLEAMGGAPEAAEEFSTAAADFEVDGDHEQAGLAWMELGELRLRLEDHQGALEALERARPLLRSAGSAQAVAACDMHAAEALVPLNPAQAVDRARRGLAVIRSGGPDHEIAWAEVVLMEAELAHRPSALDEAADLAEVLRLPATTGLLGRLQLATGRALLSQGRTEEAAEIFGEACALLDAVGDDRRLQEAHRWASSVARDEPSRLSGAVEQLSSVA